jgi:hypothetical protein
MLKKNFRFELSKRCLFHVGNDVRFERRYSDVGFARGIRAGCSRGIGLVESPPRDLDASLSCFSTKRPVHPNRDGNMKAAMRRR